MKKTLLILCIGFTLASNAQNYTFSKVTGSSYFSLSGATILFNNNWSEFEVGIKMPFNFKYWGANLGDSIFLDNWGSLSVDNNYTGEIAFLGEEMVSRGAGKTSINYIVEGAAPNRILKIEYKNVGFTGDLPGLSDSASSQIWLYETSNIMEFRYGTNKVKSGTWEVGGPYVGIYKPDDSKFMLIEGDPLNPTLNTTDIFNPNPLNGMPLNGTIYKFTPTTGSIKEAEVKVKVIDNKIVLPASTEVKSIRIFNSSGQLVQSASTVEETNLSILNHGIYFIVINTAEGVISEKKFL